MRNSMQLLASVLVLAAACSLPIRPPVPTPTPPPPTDTHSPPTASPTLPPTETPPPTATLELPTLAPPPAFSGGDFSVRVHPDGGLFPGDLVSFEVIGPQEGDLDGQEVSVSVAGEALASAGFGGFGIAGRRQATLQWVWDTSGLDPGEYEVEFKIQPAETAFTSTVTLLPPSLLAFPEPGASWAVAESDCCLVYYVTGTAAERDLARLLEAADAEADLAIAQIGVDLEEAITIVFLPRVLGHGGFAGGEIYVSYLDRNYAGNAPAQVLHHEMVHILDGRAGGNYRPSIYVEGLAVLLSGGHFKKEPIVPRAAALLAFDGYLPLEGLSNEFYFAQHEISYLQAAALIQYMVDTWGWEAFDRFYREIQPPEEDQPAAAIDAALRDAFGISLQVLESNFLAFLNDQPEDPLALADITLTVEFYDTVRRYQQVMDPSAYFLTAWLIGIQQMLDRSIVADYVRHPAAPENIALEAMLVRADALLRAGDYPGAERILAAVNAVLDEMEDASSDAFYADPLAGDFFALTHASLADGFEPQIISVVGDTATIQATAGSVDLVELVFFRSSAGWEMTP